MVPTNPCAAAVDANAAVDPVEHLREGPT